MSTTEIYSLSLHDALPIFDTMPLRWDLELNSAFIVYPGPPIPHWLLSDFFVFGRSEEHTSELQSRRDIVCRLLLEKIKTTRLNTIMFIKVNEVMNIIISTT